MSTKPVRGAGNSSNLRAILTVLALPFFLFLCLNMFFAQKAGLSESSVPKVSVPAHQSPQPQLGTPSDQNPQQPYDPNWKLTAYVADADSARAKADCNCLSARLGDGYTVTCFNTDKDMQCKMGLCHKPLTYIIEHPGRNNEARTQASKQGVYLNCDQMEVWMRKTVDDYYGRFDRRFYIFQPF
jgi:hypothetical protein